MDEFAVCPNCLGAKLVGGLPCRNCGGQTMGGIATGRAKIDPATGKGCLHEFFSEKRAPCYYLLTCHKCGEHYDIDSGD